MSELMSGNLPDQSANTNHRCRPGERRPGRRRPPVLLAIAAGWFAPVAAAQEAPPLIPVPASMEVGVSVLVLDEPLRLGAVDDVLRGVATREIARLTELLPGPARGGGQITVDVRREERGAEGYRLGVSDSGIEIAASSGAGVFYAFQTLGQLVSSAAAPDGTPRLQVLLIEDEPRFPYRGLHLDVGRHFFTVEFVKKYIDVMARFKLNRFHWHLTEDQGWRVEIDAYPRLTQVGAWRAESPVAKQLNPYVGDGTPHGGFYTKDEIRDVVAYAAERFVTVIPEIEMPGHATAAIASYPRLGCTDEELTVSTTWGVHSSIFCPSERTFEFLTSVLDEVMELFPSEYIHIGGDEVPRQQWRESDVAQEVIRREGLADEDELQSWFIRRIESHLRANGRRLIGWDEILEGGLAPDATVMAWRGTEGGIEAARQGHDVVMTPVQHSYFDFYQGDPDTEPLAMNWAGFSIPLRRVYEFEPVPPELTEEQARFVLGGQGNVWTEYIATEAYVEYMAYPRALALAEVVWSAPTTRNWEDFLTRLPAALDLLDRLEVRYRPPEDVGER